MEPNKIFQQVLNYFAGEYPHRNIHLQGTLIYIDDEAKINIDGYNLLYCLTLLCQELKEELR